MQYDIFIAYKREDHVKANNLKVVFEQQGWRVFIDTTISAGARFSMELEQALDASRSVVVLWSEASRHSRYVMDEANEGAERNILFPAMIEQTRIPSGFRGFQTVDLVHWQGEIEHLECERLIEALASFLGSAHEQPTQSIGEITDQVTVEALAMPNDARLRHKPGDIYRDTLKDGSAGPEMLIIPAGSFLMGSPKGEGHDDERPQHKVTIAQPFAMGRYAVSFDEYDAFCRASGHRQPEDQWGRGKQPAINVTWRDAVAYCQWLSEESNKDYQLPSEARWEYACRAGTTTTWNTGDKLTKKQANFGGKNKQTFEVEQYEPNTFGLYQMHGNVWEWCADPWHGNYDNAPDNGDVWTGDHPARALRGGSWLNYSGNCRCSVRYDFDPGGRGGSIGFRLSCLSPS